MIKNHCAIFLENRTLITVIGQDAACFLQRIITTDVKQIVDGDMVAGALLSPQGKIAADFLLGVRKGLFYVDIHSLLAESFIRSLYQYKLHAQVEIKKERCNLFYGLLKEERSEKKIQKTVKKLSSSPLSLPESYNTWLIFRDKRFFGKYSCMRAYIYDMEMVKEMQFPLRTRKNWDEIRILHGIAEAVIDFAPFTVFPHDVNYDQIGGLSFKKGCYIGQEVVSRMQHHGVLRKRVLIATGIKDLPAAGTIIEAGGKRIGVLGTVVEKKALALVRLDRIRAAMNADLPIIAQGQEQEITISLPERASFYYKESI